jgi:arginyl-tRNA synthetase
MNISLKKHLISIFSKAITECFGQAYAEIDPLIQPAAKPELGDYQANFALSLSKKLGRSPLSIAEEVREKLKMETAFEAVTVSGPGFINLRFSKDFINEAALSYLFDPTFLRFKTKAPETIVVDYGGANVAKELHVGHLRSAVIGDAIVRVFTLLGHSVIGQNHIGDWGTQFGMLIEYLLAENKEVSLQDVRDLNTLYRQAKIRFDEDAAFAERARSRVVLLQAGDVESLAIWQKIVEQSELYFQQVYKDLDVLLTQEQVRGESFYNPMLSSLVNNLINQGVAQKDKEAVVITLPGFVNQDKEPLPLLIRKSDGGYLYATTDLAALHFRLKELKADRIVYITDARQKLHFQMLFAAAQKAGWLDATIHLDHLASGTVLGSDKKPFKTRSGEVVRLVELLDEAKDRARAIVEARHTDLSSAEVTHRAHCLGIGALKYADLSTDLVKDTIFNWDQMLSFEGNTAPYLQNAYVRIQAIFRKGEIDSKTLQGPVSANTFEERALILKALAFADVIEQVAADLRPHKLCTYLYELAACFHGFYENCPILNHPEVAERASRLTLSLWVSHLLKQGLYLLGISTLERM